MTSSLDAFIFGISSSFFDLTVFSTEYGRYFAFNLVLTFIFVGVGVSGVRSRLGKVLSFRSVFWIMVFMLRPSRETRNDIVLAVLWLTGIVPMFCRLAELGSLNLLLVDA